MAAANELQRELQRAQNPDGGWGYRLGGSTWTEPTALAVLALGGMGRNAPEVVRGVDCLLRLKLPDGGFAISPNVHESSWVTALALLVQSGQDKSPAPETIRWLLDRTGEESRLVVRLRMWLLGSKSSVSNEFDGWPWFPGTAAWVAPTAWTILALDLLNRRSPDPALQRRVEQGRQFLLSRQCQDSGWNHGGTRALGYEAPSYPETTGLALLALRGQRSSAIENAARRAGSLAANCSSIHALSLLALGLRAQGKPFVMKETPISACRTTLDLSLELIARLAVEGKGPFA